VSIPDAGNPEETITKTYVRYLGCKYKNTAEDTDNELRTLNS